MSAVLHELKCWPTYFDALSRGEKTFEIRRDDRGFQKGDILVLHRFDPEKGYLRDRHTGETIKIRRRITYILTGGQLGIEPGYVILGLRRA